MNLKKITLYALVACMSAIMPALQVSAASEYEFRTSDDGKQYWYEDGIKQGTYEDVIGVLGDGTIRGREIYDSVTDGWYWLDSVNEGAKAVGKEVWIPYIYQDELIMSSDGFGRMANGIEDEAKIQELSLASNTYEAQMAAQVENAIRNRTGKWVRYDENGMMLKGWVKIEGNLAECYPNQIGNVYYYDRQTGLMAKGNVIINGIQYHFDETTGVLDSNKPILNFTPNAEGFIVFGCYEQDGNIENGNEPIEWDVIDDNENGLLCVSRYVLDCKQYNTEDVDVTWETCSLRAWMNGEFLNTAFAPEEINHIQSVNLSNSQSVLYETYGGNDTIDNVFCLSADEIFKYYDSINEFNASQWLMIPSTPYAMNMGVRTMVMTQQVYDLYYDQIFANGDFTSDCIGMMGSLWWLRSPGSSGDVACAVYVSGMVSSNEYSIVDSTMIGVRPAIYIRK